MILAVNVSKLPPCMDGAAPVTLGMLTVLLDLARNSRVTFFLSAGHPLN